MNRQQRRQEARQQRRQGGPPAGTLNLLQLALAHQRAGRLAQAEALYQDFLLQQPQHAEALHLLGMLKHQTGDNQAALDLIQRALALNPQNAALHTDLGNVLAANDRLADAIGAYRRALALDPRQVAAASNLGAALYFQGRLEEATAWYRTAITADPRVAEPHSNLGNVLKDQGKVEEAVAEYETALRLNPDFPVLESNLLMALHYRSTWTPEEVFVRHRAFGERYRHLTPTAPRFPNPPDPNRRLRIGYCSPDFRSHSVAYFFEPILAAHDRSQFEVFCYSNTMLLDEVTQRLHGLASHWRDLRGLNDNAAAEQVRRDGIDLFIDLAGHTSYNRLLVFARRPAPVQLTYLGYPDTTGLPAIDYRVSDAWADPPGMTERWHTERLLRLEDGFDCYQPPAGAPEVGPLPASRSGHVTFGSFNAIAKVGPELVALWAAILRAIPTARLLVKSRALLDPGTREHLLGLFAQQQIGPERLDIVGYIRDVAGHLDAYNHVDVAFDTFPYHGTTTSCDALWMGVPVLTLAGETHASRVGVSLLSRVGLADLIASTSEAYVRRAVELAGDVTALQQYRATLRERMRRSSLTAAAAFTRTLESAYRRVWREWCACQEAGVTTSAQSPRV